MLPIEILRMRKAGPPPLDTQSVTVGSSGTAGAQDRRRGYISGSLGAISDGTSDIYGGATITELYWDENAGLPYYYLTITGAANSGWTTMTIGTQTFTRASAGYASGTWSWPTSDTATTHAFTTGTTVTFT